MSSPETKSANATERPARTRPTLPPFDDSRVVKYQETEGWEVLRRVADPVVEFGPPLSALVSEMTDIMHCAHGCGLAAPQIGKSIRLAIYDAGHGVQVLVNPKILRERGEQFEPEEGCLSIPGLRGVVRRPNVITVRAWDIDGNDRIFKATEFEARVICHEMDHLDGVLFVDKADPKTLHMLTAEERAAEDGLAE